MSTHQAFSDNRSFLSTTSKASKKSRFKSKIFEMFKKKKEEVAALDHMQNSKTNMEYIRLSDHFRKKDKRGSNKIQRDSLVLFKLEDIKQIKQEDKVKIVKQKRRKNVGKPPRHVERIKNVPVETRHITAETKATSVLSIAGPDQTIEDLNSAMMRRGVSPSATDKGDNCEKDESDSSDFFDGSVDEDMEFEDDKKTCMTAAIGQIPLSASLKRERQHQGSNSRQSLVSDSTIKSSVVGESPAVAAKDKEEEAAGQQEEQEDVMVAISMSDVLKDKTLHDIVELKAQSVIYKVDYVKTLDNKHTYESNESSQVEFLQIESSENKTSSHSKKGAAINQALDGCQNVRLSVMNQDEFDRAVIEQNKIKMENLSQSVYRKKSKIIEVSMVDEPSENDGYSVPDEMEELDQENSDNSENKIEKESNKDGERSQKSDRNSNGGDSLMAEQTDFDEEEEDQMSNASASDESESEEEEQQKEDLVKNEDIENEFDKQLENAVPFDEQVEQKSEKDKESRISNLSDALDQNNKKEESEECASVESPEYREGKDDGSDDGKEAPKALLSLDKKTEGRMSISSKGRHSRKSSYISQGRHSRKSSYISQDLNVKEVKESYDQLKNDINNQIYEEDHDKLKEIDSQEKVKEKEVKCEQDKQLKVSVIEDSESKDPFDSDYEVPDPVQENDKEDSLLINDDQEPIGPDDLSQNDLQLEAEAEAEAEQAEDEDLHMEETQRPDNLSSKSEDNQTEQSDLMDLEDMKNLKMKIIDSEDSEQECEEIQEVIQKQSLIKDGFESIISDLFKSNRLQSSPQPYVEYFEYLRHLSGLNGYPYVKLVEILANMQKLKLVGLIRIDHTKLFKRSIKNYVPTPTIQPQIVNNFLTVETTQKFEDDQVNSPETGSNSLNSSMNLSMLNGSLEIKGSVSLNLEDTLAFIDALTYDERINTVTKLCQDKSDDLFGTLDGMQLIKSELIYNGHAAKYLHEGSESEMLEEFMEQFNKLKSKLQENVQMSALMDGELLAVMLFTHENQELYRDIKTNMTGKKMDKRILKAGANEDKNSLSFSYLQWKQQYQERAKRSYRWPALQALLQLGVTKIGLSKEEPDRRFLNYGLAFLCVNTINEDEKQYSFEFEFPQKCPFSSSTSLTLIESIKIFGLVKMELVKFINQNIKFDQSHMTSQNRKGFKKFKDRLHYKKSQTSRMSIQTENRDINAQARFDAGQVVSTMLNSSIIFQEKNPDQKSVIGVYDLPSPLLGKVNEVRELQLQKSTLIKSSNLPLEKQSELIISQYQAFRESQIAGISEIDKKSINVSPEPKQTLRKSNVKDPNKFSSGLKAPKTLKKPTNQNLMNSATKISTSNTTSTNPKSFKSRLQNPSSAKKPTPTANSSTKLRETSTTKRPPTINTQNNSNNLNQPAGFTTPKKSTANNNKFVSKLPSLSQKKVNK